MVTASPPPQEMPSPGSGGIRVNLDSNTTPTSKGGSGVGSGSSSASSGVQQIQQFLREANAVAKKASSWEVPSTVEGLNVLALQGSWREIIERMKEAPVVVSPHERLVWFTCKVLSYMKLRQWGAAAQELRDMGGLESASWRYESYPEHYHGRKGTMVPFELVYLQALLQVRLGHVGQGMDWLYKLLSSCITEQQKASQISHGWSEGDAGAGCLPLTTSTEERGARWQRNQELILVTLANHHLASKDFQQTLWCAQQLLGLQPNNATYPSFAGYTLLQIGDLVGAETMFQITKDMAAQLERGEIGAALEVPAHFTIASLRGLVKRNEGLLAFARQDYNGAYLLFDEALQLNEHDVVAANNKAMCLMYSQKLLNAVEGMEANFMAEPSTFLYEPFLLNVCSMYELASLDSTNSKRLLSSYISRVAPDDFDLMCTRLST